MARCYAVLVNFMAVYSAVFHILNVCFEIEKKLEPQTFFYGRDFI